MSDVARLFAVFLAVVLAGCGGGMQAGVGSGGSGAPVDPLSVGVGTVTGFGSIIANGVRYDETAAQVFVDERPDRAEPATVAAIQLGTRIELEHRNLVIARATVLPELIGPVSSVSASAFEVLGQTVRINADPVHPTAFDGFGTLSDLAQGGFVEVHGERAPSGEIVATRVQLRPAGTAIRVSGTVTTASGRTFGIGPLAVDAWSATLLPVGAAIAVGQRVVVWTDAGYSGGALIVRLVRVDTPMIAEAATVTVDGLVSALQGTAFRIGTVPVDTRSAAFSGGTGADLANGRAVRVRGRYANGVLAASTVEILAPAPVTVQISGAITDFVDADRPFRVRDTVVRVTPQTGYTGGSATNLGSGVRVQVRGTLVDGVVEATAVEFQAPPAESISTVVGRIAPPLGDVAADGSRTIRLEGAGTDVKTTPQTVYGGGTAADIAIGRQVRVRGRVQQALLLADEVQFLDSPAAPSTVEIDGTAGNVRADSLIVNGQRVLRTAATTYTLNGAAATPDVLRNGVAVLVEAARAGETLTATTIDVRSTQAVATMVRGLVSGRTPPGATRFLVGSQRVDVGGNPQIIPGSKSLADIVNGADVEVQGSLADGVLNATRIKLR
jgi:hypothetical protein